MVRKQELVNESIYHIFNKSIAGFVIYNSEFEYSRFINLIKYYRHKQPPVRYSRLIEYSNILQNNIIESLPSNDKLVEIISYCIMPTHFHIILKQLKKHGISNFINNIGNSYTHYFNNIHKRKGPLWVGPFKNVLVSTDDQLLHLTRYIHLNPTSSNLVSNPNEWVYSSYKEFINKEVNQDNFCQYQKYLDITPGKYQSFCEEYIDDQKELSIIKHILLE